MAGIKLDTDTLISNVIPQSVLRKVQEKVLKDLADVLANCYGPDASNTLIMIPTGTNGTASNKPISKYTKDGRHIQEKVVYTDMLANAIAGQIESITSNVDGEVGDGTTSATLLAYFIFDAMLGLERKYKLSPKNFMKMFKETINEIKDSIESMKEPATSEDIYNIAYTSTNGDDIISNEIHEIYKKFGMNVWINVGLSNSNESMVKAYDGLTLEVGYSDAAYVNTEEGVVRLRKPRIYQFTDPIDTSEMVSFLRKIISDNIISCMKAGICIPTLIIAPKISRDADAVIRSLVTMLYQYNEQNMISQKPPIAIVTNIGPHKATFFDIAQLCGCKKIIKYIDPKVQAEDVEKGLAPSLDNISDWYGTAEMVEINEYKTAFVNPKEMFETHDGKIVYQDNKPVPTATYATLMNFLESELNNAINTGEDANTIGNLRRRIHSLESSLVDYYVGGISTEDITAIKDSVDDAVKNCRSAAQFGIGPAGNCAGYLATMDLLQKIAMSKEVSSETEQKENFLKAIYKAYRKLLCVLYTKSYSDDDIDNIILPNIVKKRCPLNLQTGGFDNKVLCSIKTDIAILDAVSEIISYMFTSNQALLPIASAKYTEALGAQL